MVNVDPFLCCIFQISDNVVPETRRRACQDERVISRLALNGVFDSGQMGLISVRR